MKLNPNVLKIELGCDDWDEPLILGDDAIFGLTNPAAHEPTTAPPPELLSINHHEVLAQTLIQFELLKDSAADQACRRASIFVLQLVTVARCLNINSYR